MKLLAAAMLIMAVFAVSDACGQAYPYYGGGGGVYGGYAPRSSTVGESYLRGSADLVRSAGERNLLDSQAAQGYAQARSMELDNRLKYADTYFARRRVNQEYRDENRKPAPTEEQIFRMAKAAEPKRLAPSQVDPVTGKINWPPLLMTDQFAAEREIIDPLFTRMIKDGHLDYNDALKVRKACGDMRQRLIAIIRSVPGADQRQANTFVNQLEYEVRQTSS
ncbi:MAG: hypothetical protein P8N76_21325 [Pirellulaceae bacterium]|nr:hypothetical protein [Pirellulaceae bacterium]